MPFDLLRTEYEERENGVYLPFPLLSGLPDHIIHDLCREKYRHAVNIFQPSKDRFRQSLQNSITAWHLIEELMRTSGN